MGILKIYNLNLVVFEKTYYGKKEKTENRDGFGVLKFEKALCGCRRMQNGKTESEVVDIYYERFCFFIAQKI